MILFAFLNYYWFYLIVKMATGTVKSKEAADAAAVAASSDARKRQ